MVFSLFTRTLPATEWRSFMLSGKTCKVRIMRRRNARRLTMRVRGRSVHATVPISASTDDIERFLASNQDWIDDQLMQEQRAIETTLNDSGGPSVFYLGELMQVRLCRDENHHGKGRIEVAYHQLTIRISADSTIRPVRVLEHWLKSQARDAIRAELDDVLPLLDQDPVPLSIRDQKTRWGSCSSTRRLSFNWRLIMAPPACLRYVVVHEAAHLVHHDHSPRFWGLVEELMPEYHQYQQWLRQNQVALFAEIDHRLGTLHPDAAH
jgi:predicted metal-dependent hydrolase